MLRLIAAHESNFIGYNPAMYQRPLHERVIDAATTITMRTIQLGSAVVVTKALLLPFALSNGTLACITAGGLATSYKMAKFNQVTQTKKAAEKVAKETANLKRRFRLYDEKPEHPVAIRYRFLESAQKMGAAVGLNGVNIEWTDERKTIPAQQILHDHANNNAILLIDKTAFNEIGFKNSENITRHEMAHIHYRDFDSYAANNANNVYLFYGGPIMTVASYFGGGLTGTAGFALVAAATWWSCNLIDGLARNHILRRRENRADDFAYSTVQAIRHKETGHPSFADSLEKIDSILNELRSKLYPRRQWLRAQSSHPYEPLRIARLRRKEAREQAKLG